MIPSQTEPVRDKSANAPTTGMSAHSQGRVVDYSSQYDQSRSFRLDQRSQDASFDEELTWPLPSSFAEDRQKHSFPTSLHGANHYAQHLDLLALSNGGQPIDSTGSPYGKWEENTAAYSTDRSVDFPENVFDQGKEPQAPMAHSSPGYRFPPTSARWTGPYGISHDPAFTLESSSDATYMAGQDMMEIPLVQQHHASLRRFHHEQALAAMPASAFRTFGTETAASRSASASASPAAPSRQAPRRQRRLSRNKPNTKLEQLYSHYSTRGSDSPSTASGSRRNSGGSSTVDQLASPSSASATRPTTATSVSSGLLSEITLHDGPSPAIGPRSDQVHDGENAVAASGESSLRRFRSFDHQEESYGASQQQGVNSESTFGFSHTTQVAGMPAVYSVNEPPSAIDDSADCVSIDADGEADPKLKDSELTGYVDAYGEGEGEGEADGDVETETSSSVKSRSNRNRPRNASSASMDSNAAEVMNAARAASARQRRSQATEVSNDLASILREPNDGQRLSRTALLSRALRRITEAHERERELEARLRDARDYIRRLGGNLD